ncbi:tyramine receptor 1-like [Antedon mediterranea]|uniref:tyramine receptor 1-like n=1 Tax=Antedon mediterranea TaxID=105859 RepID=UPI003AF9D9A5
MNNYSMLSTNSYDNMTLLSEIIEQTNASVVTSDSTNSVTNNVFLSITPTENVGVPISTVEKVIEVTVLTIICVTALSGNALLWAVILNTRSLRSTTSALLLCLSSADIMVSVINMPFTIYSIINGGWDLGILLCKGLGFTNMLTFVASVMSLAAISVNRYAIIVSPQKYTKMASKRYTGYLILGVWVLSAMLAALPFLGWSTYEFIDNQSFCFCNWTEDQSYAFFMIGVCFGGPCSIMLYCYWNILNEVKRSRRRVCSPLGIIDTDVDRQVSLRRFRRLFSAKRRDSQLSNLSEIRGNSVYSIAGTVPMRKLSEGSDENKTCSKEKINTGNNIIITNCTDSDVDFSVRRKSEPSANKLKVTYDLRETNSDCDPSLLPKRSSSDKGIRTSPWKHRQSSTVSIGMKKSSIRKRREGETKLAVTFLIVVCMFIVCWLPFCITMIWAVLDGARGQGNGPPRILDVATLILGYFNSCCNPIIYGIRNKKFRDAYKSVFQFKKKAFKRELNFKLKNGRNTQIYTHTHTQ